MKQLAFAVCLASLLAATVRNETVRITVDAGKVLGPWKRVEGFYNTSLRNAPPPELATRVVEEYGKPRITRVWLPLDDMWDYRTGQYNFNFQCGKDTYVGDNTKHRYERDKTTETNVLFYDYMDAFSRHSEELLLNIRRYEHEVTRGIISITKWKEIVKIGLKHYKLRYPNLRYIEVLNEAHVDHFGGLDDDRYYGFYRVGYQIVNELNQELKPAVPLLVGGPSTVGSPMRPADLDRPPDAKNRTQRMNRFLTNFAQDSDPTKRLDFLSFHDYGLAAEPWLIASYDSLVREWLKKAGLPTGIPIFETEIGAAKVLPDPALNLRNAAGLSTFFYYTKQDRNFFLFPWVLYHNPVQLSVVQFAEGLRLTPFGAALKAWAMHKGNEASVSWLRSSSARVYAVASIDESGLAVQAWNYSDKPATTEIILENLPAPLTEHVRLKQYLVDSGHSNCLLNQKAPCALEAVEDAIRAKAPTAIKLELEPFAVAFMTIEVAKRQ